MKRDPRKPHGRVSTEVTPTRAIDPAPAPEYTVPEQAHAPTVRPRTMRVRCFMITPTDEVQVTLRRFSAATICGRRAPRYPGGGVVTYDVHDVEFNIGREHGTLTDPEVWGDSTRHTIPLDDPRWPGACVCGFVFPADAARQEWRGRLFRRGDTGELVTVHDAPAGALYDSRSFSGIDGYQRNGAGMSLVCKTPAGEWMIDGPASNGPGWTRTGTPPDIRVTPSIGIGKPQRMHGWLGKETPGWLEIDMVDFELAAG